MPVYSPYAIDYKKGVDFDKTTGTAKPRKIGCMVKTADELIGWWEKKE